MGKQSKLWRKQTVLAKAGNEPEIFRAKAKIEGMRKHALEKFDEEDVRYQYWNCGDTARYLRYKERIESVRKYDHSAKIKEFFEDNFREVENAHDAYYLHHLEECAKAVQLLHKADLEEARLKEGIKV